jgi:hypothetical protein
MPFWYAPEFGANRPSAVEETAFSVDWSFWSPSNPATEPQFQTEWQF